MYYMFIEKIIGNYVFHLNVLFVGNTENFPTYKSQYKVPCEKPSVPRPGKTGKFEPLQLSR